MLWIYLFLSTILSEYEFLNALLIHVVIHKTPFFGMMLLSPFPPDRLEIFGCHARTFTIFAPKFII